MVFIDDKKENEHVISVLRQVQKSLRDKNSFQLHQLSDQVIHSASTQQHTDLIMIMVVVYSLNKIVSRMDHVKIKNWPIFVRKFSAEIDKAIESLKLLDAEEFARHIEHARGLLFEISPDAKTDINEVLKKASINKAGKIYEHGVSMSRTANLLGISPWELTEYLGERMKRDDPHLFTYDIKKRAATALDFFS